MRTDSTLSLFVFLQLSLSVRTCKGTRNRPCDLKMRTRYTRTFGTNPKSPFPFPLSEWFQSPMKRLFIHLSEIFWKIWIFGMGFDPNSRLFPQNPTQNSLLIPSAYSVLRGGRIVLEKNWNNFEKELGKHIKKYIGIRKSCLEFWEMK